VLHAIVLLLHLACFAAYLGAGFAQLQMMKRSTGATGELQKVYEDLAASILVKLELPAIFGSVLTGAFFVAQTPEFMKQGWLHGKLLCVLVLLVLSHLEMFNAKKIGRLRREGGATAENEITARKSRHQIFGTIGTVAVVVLLVCVTVVRLAG